MQRTVAQSGKPGRRTVAKSESNFVHSVVEELTRSSTVGSQSWTQNQPQHGTHFSCALYWKWYIHAQECIGTGD